MTIGTRSVLFGAHQFLIHPLFVAAAWWKLYGVPYQPWLWLAFFVHDIGYFGKPNMDGPEGEEHPWTGARIMYWVQGAWLFLRQPVFYSEPRLSRPLRWWMVRRRWASAHLSVARQSVIWGNEVLFHSRYLARRYQAPTSRLCVADKLSFVLTPRWLYLPMVIATGEIAEYMSRALTKYPNEQIDFATRVRWHKSVAAYLTAWVDEHKDGRADTWTPAASESRPVVSSSGVYQ